MKITFASRAWEDYLHWQSADAVLLAKVNGLIAECRRSPFSGTGKPEPLKGRWTGWWSRRSSSKHRLIYRVSGQGDERMLQIAQCRLHYQ